MKETNRRGFLKTCACAACFCGFSSIFKIAAQEETPKTDNTQPAETEAERTEKFNLQWITTLLDSLDNSGLSEAQLRAIVKTTSMAHHDLLNVPEMVKPYIGKPNDFIDFLQSSWGWVVKEDKGNRMLIVDENKPFCVCPLLKHSKGKLYPALCYCSEGFAEKMFSLVYQRPVSVNVAASVQRGNPSCIYHIRY